MQSTMHFIFSLDNLTKLEYNEVMKQWTPEEIKDFRLRLGLYQKGLAELLRVSTNYVYLMEKGVKKPGSTMKALLDCIEREYGKGKGVKHHGSKGHL